MTGAPSDITANASLFGRVYMLNGDILVQGGVKTSFRASGSPLMVKPIGLGVHPEVPANDVDMRHMLALSLENEQGEPVPIARR